MMTKTKGARKGHERHAKHMKYIAKRPDGEKCLTATGAKHSFSLRAQRVS